MAQTNLTIRIDEDIKREAENLFNRIGLNMSAAINVFFRQSIREQAIPFELKPYDDYYTGKRLNRIRHSIAQAERGEIVTKSIAELETMENVGKSDPKDDVLIGSIYRFGGIDWKVLDADGDMRLLISQDILETRAYNVDKEKKETCWEQCSLRGYLNNDFYNSFVPKDRARVVLHNIINDDNPWTYTPGGNVTKDYIWLLSLEEVSSYFGDSLDQLHDTEKKVLMEQLKRDCKDYYGNDAYTSAVYWIDFIEDNEVYVTDNYSTNRKANIGNKGASMWWLRSPGAYSDRAACVDEYGKIIVDGTDSVYNGGVRPALWLYL